MSDNKADFEDVLPPGNDEDFENLVEFLDSIRDRFDEIESMFVKMKEQQSYKDRMTAIVKGRALPTSLAAYGPYALEVFVPELGDDKSSTRIVRCRKPGGGRVVLPAKGEYVSVYFDAGQSYRMYWELGAVDGFPSQNKEEIASEAKQLAVDSLLTDIAIYESNKNFKFLCDRTIPGLHKVLMELSSPLGRFKIKTGAGGKIQIGDGETGVDLDIDVGGKISITAGALIGSIDIFSGGIPGSDITLSAGLGDIILDAANIELTSVTTLVLGGPSVKLGAAASVPVNNLPNCLFTGTPHSTNLTVKA
jgi:hypothetical protein